MLEFFYHLSMFFVLGICVGSFLNVLIYRLPEEKSVFFPPSACGACGKPLRPWHNIPLVSWIALRGKSACCGEKISVQYPIVELLGGLIFVVSFLKLSWTIDAVVIGVVFSLLLALSVIDMRYLVAYDSLNLATLSIAVFHDADILQNITNAFLLAGALTLLRFYVSYFIKKEAMGEGDIIIAATMGAVLGITNAFVAVFVSAVLALPIILIAQRIKKTKQLELPFIPFLVLGMGVVFVFDDFFVRLFGW